MTLDITIFVVDDRRAPVAEIRTANGPTEWPGSLPLL